MNRTLSVLAVAGAALALAAPASTHSTGPVLIIHHQMRGCHAWSYNGGPSKVSQTIVLKRGTHLSIGNNDVMPHKLVQFSGLKLKLPATANMNSMGAMTEVRFTKVGVYTFRTKAGEDYKNMGMMKTIGEDNVLRLKVTVR
jgi:hypothetical protein